MRSIHPPPRAVRSHGTAMRVFALFTAFWLWMLPQMMNARATVVMPDDLGSCPAPVSEEEETKHADTLPLSAIAHQATDKREDGARCPAAEDGKLLCGDHGEVPTPPPWA